MYQALAAQVMERAEALAAFSEEEGRLTRPSFTPSMRRAHEALAGWMRGAGMAVHEDNIGNLVGSYPAERPSAPALLLGSHLDSVRDAGKYDGPLGVLVGLAAVERLAAEGRRLPFAVEVAALCDEEGLRFQSAFFGSKTLAGSFTPDLLELHDDAGISLAAAIRSFGGDPARIGEDARRPGELLGYCEVHIEQGPLLEARGLPVGVVSAITGISRTAVSFRGVAGHAGTVPMALRRDALAAAAEFVLAAETLARASTGLVATVGQIAVEPGASNVIPAAANLSLDVRHQDDATLGAALTELRARAEAIAAARNIELIWHEIQRHPAVPMDPDLRARLARAVGAAGHTPFELPSGAGHDAAVMAAIAPAAMLFVRCRGGVSHNPAEAVEPADVAVAIEVISRLLDDLAANANIR